MQKKVFYLFLVICTMSFFSSCKDDDNKIDDGPATDWATEIAGTYKGDLGVTVDGNDLGTSTQFIYISRENTNVTKLELKNFKIVIAGTPLKVGDITVSNIPVTAANSTAMLEETSTVINHPALGQLDVTVSGTITNGKAALFITVFAVKLNQNIEVVFDGNKTNEVETPADYAAEVAAWYARESLTATGDTVDTKWPNDGLSVEYQDVNTIFIKSFYLSFPANVSGAVTTRKIPQIDSIELVEYGNKLLIDTMLITVPPGSKQDTAYLALSGDFEGNTLTLNMTLRTQDKKVSYVFTGTKKLTGASLEELTFNSNVITIQPEIAKAKNDNGNYPVIIYVKEGTTDAQLNLVPTFKISEGATITQSGEEYIPGTPVDFSTEQKFTISSQSGITKNVYVFNHEVLNTNFDFSSGFETWKTINETTKPENMYLMYDEPANGWATSNGGVHLIKSFFGDVLYGKNDPYVVEQTTDAKSGSKAAKLTTIFTKGANVGFIAVPVVTSATVFSGAFIVNTSNTLKSTKFGYPCTKKPASFSGSYKYTPGETYLYCPDPVKNADKVDTVKTKTDAPAINAVLYEVENYAFDFLDGTNLLTSDKIVAKASLKDESAKASYTDFNIKFEWMKEFNSAKRYKLAIVCSSSKDGDKFTGAPGSVLYVDDLKVTFE